MSYGYFAVKLHLAHFRLVFSSPLPTGSWSIAPEEDLWTLRSSPSYFAGGLILITTFLGVG